MTPAIAPLPRRWAIVFGSIGILLLVSSSYLLVLSAVVGSIWVPLLILMNKSHHSPDLLDTIMGGYLVGASIMGPVILWSLFPRRKRFVQPGPLLERSSHPRLFRELDDIAEALNEESPKEVYLLPNVNAWVAHRGGIMGLGGRRVLGVGLPLFSILTVSQFRAVVAHEFGHYYHGDTRLVPLAYRTQAALVRTSENTALFSTSQFILGVSQIWSLMHTLLRTYQEFFLRMSARFSQPQEYRADELACHLTSPQTLIQALQQMHKWPGLFSSFWEKEVMPILMAGYIPPISEGLARYLEAPEIVKAGEQILSTEMQEVPQYRLKRDTGLKLLSITDRNSAFDSHPALYDRVMAAIGLPELPVVSNSDKAITLLDDLEKLERNVVENLCPALMNAPPLPVVTWHDSGNLITVPMWKRTVAKVSHLLAGITVEGLPYILPQLRQISVHVPNPRGMLLDAQQREKRAVEVLGMALGLVLLSHGWELYTEPGQLSLRREKSSLNSMKVIEDIVSGDLSAERWSVECRSLGITGLLLSDGAALSASPT